MLGVAGLLGAGRTELLEAIFAASLFHPSGTIRLDGHPVRVPATPTGQSRPGSPMVTEDRKTLGLFDHMTVAENITLRRLPELTLGPLIDPRAENRAVAWSINELAIKTAGGDVPVTSLSGGNQRSASLARWLLIEPKVVLLDEPTRRQHRCRRPRPEIYGLDSPAGRRGPGHHHDLERVAGAPGRLGPDYRSL